MPDRKDVAQQAKNSFIKDAAKAMPVVEGVKGAEKVADNTPDRKNTPNTSKTDKMEGGENQKPANESGNDKKTTNEKDKTEGENTSKEKNPSDETEGRKVTREDNGGKTGSGVETSGEVKETEIEKIDGERNNRTGTTNKTEADFIVTPGGVVYSLEDYAKMMDFEHSSTLYHYTTEQGMQGILDSQRIYPSIKTLTTKDARMGSGQYLTDIVPGSKTAGQTSRILFGVPWNTSKVSYYVEIDVSDLNILKGKDGVYYVPDDADLDLTGRIVSFGKRGG